MKQLIKKTLLGPVLYAALNMRDKGKLTTVPKHKFTTEALGTSPDLDTIFSNTDTKKQWEIDSEKISTIFGDEYTSGGINLGDRRALYYLLKALKPEKVLEVGTHIGASTIHIAYTLKGLSETAKVITVDILDVNDTNAPWKKLGLKMSPRDYVQKLECLDRLSFKAQPALSFMGDTQEKYDFIFLDGDHSSTAVYQEVSAALKLLNPGGLILLHDYYPGARSLFPNGTIISGPFNALSRICKENPDIKAHPLGNLPWKTKEGVNVTSLALVTRK